MWALNHSLFLFFKKVIYISNHVGYLSICQESEQRWMFVKQVNHVRYLSRRYTMLDVCQESGPCWSL